MDTDSLFTYNAKTWLVHERKVQKKMKYLERQGYDRDKLYAVRRNPFLPGKMLDGTLTSYIRHVDHGEADLASIRTIAEFDKQEEVTA